MGEQFSEAEVRPTQKVKFFAFLFFDSKGSPGVLIRSGGQKWSEVGQPRPPII